MNTTGGYTSQLDFAVGTSTGASALLPESCWGSVNGTSNPDGQCILGGVVTKAGVCDATPIFLQTMVPYTTGNVSGTRFDDLNNLKYYTKVKQQVLLNNARRVSAPKTV